MIKLLNLLIFSHNSPPLFFPTLKVAKFHMKFALIIFSPSQICLLRAWLAEFQIIFSEVPKQMILNGLIGISNCSPESTHTKEVLPQKRINTYFKMATSTEGEESRILPAVFLVVYSSLVASSLGLLTKYFIILRAWRPPIPQLESCGRKARPNASTLLHLPEVNGMFVRSYKHA